MCIRDSFHADYNYAQILYDKNDLSGESAPGEVLTLTDASALLAGADQFAREGMVLTGWCETADGSGAIFKPGAEFSISEDALKALYASGDPTRALIQMLNGKNEAPKSISFDGYLEIRDSI